MRTQIQPPKGPNRMQTQPSHNKNGGKAAPPAMASKPTDATRVFTEEEDSGAIPKPKEEPKEAENLPELTPEQKRALFDAVFLAEKAIATAEAAVRDAQKARSARVKELIHGMHGKLGPWRVNGGVMLRARVRGDSAYLLRPDEADVEEI
jgi:hypothetical protein